MRRGSFALACGLVLAAATGPAGAADPAPRVTRPADTSDSNPSLPVGCPPLGGGSDGFPAVATLVIDDSGFGQPFVVRLSSANHPDAVVQYTAQVGDSISTELVQLELSGFHPRIGAVALRQSPTQQTLGQIENVELDESCQLSGGDAYFDAFFEIDVNGGFETWDHAAPFRLEARITSLPEENSVFEVTTVQAIDLQDQTTSQLRGELLYAAYRFEPAFPPAGQDCFDALLLADVHLFGPGSTRNLIGFGPTGIERGTPVPGGVCSVTGAPCTSDLQCPLQTCLKARVDTEIVDLAVGGFDAVLGEWQVAVLPEQGDSDCCAIHPEPGCSDPTCEALICSMDSFCCSDTWDDLCAGLANNEPLCSENCFDPNAAPTVGKVQSVQVGQTYPASSDFDLFLRLDSDTQGSLHNQDPIPLAPLGPLTNLPPDPSTEYRYSGTPVPLYDSGDNLAGEISNVVHTLQPPLDCEPPPAAAEDCLDGQLHLEWALSPCPTETLTLPGGLRLLRGDPTDSGGLGQEVVETLLAGGEFTVTSGCHGSVTLRVAAASPGGVSSLAPEEFYPADSSHEVQIEIDVAGQTLTTDPFTLAASVNTLPFESSETHFGPDTAVDLLDATASPMGSIVAIRHETLGPVVCSAQFRSEIRFPGPSKDALDVSIPLVGGGGVYDVVRGGLNALHASAGSFGSATCIETDVDPAVSDSGTPAPGDGFYYVARDGLGPINGTWNGSGTSQAGDRDALLPSCVSP